LPSTDAGRDEPQDAAGKQPEEDAAVEDGATKVMVSINALPPGSRFAEVLRAGLATKPKKYKRLDPIPLERPEMERAVKALANHLNSLFKRVRKEIAKAITAAVFKWVTDLRANVLRSAAECRHQAFGLATASCSWW
jgi:hypothetical protein